MSLCRTGGTNVLTAWWETAADACPSLRNFSPRRRARLGTGASEGMAMVILGVCRSLCRDEVFGRFFGVVCLVPFLAGNKSGTREGFK